MTALAAGDIVWIAFPFVEIGVRKPRPALVVSEAGLGLDAELFWAAMITGAGKARWPGDLDIPDFSAAGLPIPSIVRPAKLATLMAADANPIGRLDTDSLHRVRHYIHASLGFGRRP